MTLSPDAHQKIPKRIPTGTKTNIALTNLSKKETISANTNTEILRMSADCIDGDIAIKQPSGNQTLTKNTFTHFEKEAEISLTLDHNHIVELVDWGKQPFPWLGFEYMDGGSLSERIESLSLANSLWIAVSIADAIWEAHTIGIAHLDIKPNNILFRKSSVGVWDVPKVCDWGVSKSLFDTDKDNNALSPKYAAPEQFKPEEYDSPDNITDIYQFGTLLYEILAGEKVFTGDSVEVMYKHTNESPIPPTEIDPSLPAAADDILSTALSKSREERYESMLDFRRDLESLFYSTVHDLNSNFICDQRTVTTTNEQQSESESSNDESREESDGTTTAGQGNPDNNANQPTLWNAELNISEELHSRSTSEHKKEVPWQYRDNPPGMNSENDQEENNNK